MIKHRTIHFLNRISVNITSFMIVTILLPQMLYANNIGSLIWLYTGPVIFIIWLSGIISNILFIRKLNNYERALRSFDEHNRDQKQNLFHYKKKATWYILFSFLFIFLIVPIFFFSWEVSSFPYQLKDNYFILFILGSLFFFTISVIKKSIDIIQDVNHMKR